jgi:hypothetical protein
VLAQRLGEAEVDASALVAPAEGSPTPVAPPPAALALEPTAPRLGTTARHIERPQAPIAQARCDRGKKTCHTVPNMELIHTALMILLRSDTTPGSTHDKRMAEAAPSPLPTGSLLLQDRGFLAFTLD